MGDATVRTTGYARPITQAPFRVFFQRRRSEAAQRMVAMAGAPVRRRRVPVRDERGRFVRRRAV